MSVHEKIQALSKRAKKVQSLLATEEATKTSLVLPFIDALGYDIFDPSEVVPEFTADVGVKKGERVDYCIKINNIPVMIFEVKSASCSLSEAEHSQLFRYFSASETRIGILTNRTQYNFFSDIESANVMDSKPFLVLDLMNLRDGAIEEIKRLGRDSFDLENMLEAASELKYTREIRRLIETQLEDPEDDFVRFFFTKINPNGRFVNSARCLFKKLVTNAYKQAVSERVTDRLKNALEREEPPTEVAHANDPARSPEAREAQSAVGFDNIETTEEEIEAFQIIKSIARETIDASRIGYRDAKSYMAVLVDENNRRPLCRLWFNGKQKRIGIFDEHKNETKMDIGCLDDIYRFAHALKATASRYARTPASDSASAEFVQRLPGIMP